MRKVLILLTAENDTIYTNEFTNEIKMKFVTY